MIHYRFLTAGDFPALHGCFLAAFSDYEVNMRATEQQFEQRLRRDGVQLEMSAGAFDRERMIGFCINGVGSWQQKKTAYDAGTGIVPNCRGKGIGKELFVFLVPRLKEAGCVQYLLEVLTSNHAAISLYHKVGFKDTRMLAVFRRTEPLKPFATSSISLRRTTEPDWPLFQRFWDGHPSWQNSIAAVERITKERTIICARVNDECAGYGVLFSPASILMQLAVAPKHRRKGIGSAILSALQHEAKENLKVNNIDEHLGARAFYEANHFKLVLRQHEMIRIL